MHSPARLAIAVVSLVVAVAACGGGGGGGSAAPTGDATEVITATFKQADVEMWGQPVSITNDEEQTFYLGSTNYPDFTSTAIVQPMMSIDPRIAYVLETSTEAEAIATMDQLKKDIDPNKLICVTFSVDDVRQERRGTVVFMVIDSDHTERDALADAFLAIP
jgi:hypothetical protein